MVQYFNVGILLQNVGIGPINRVSPFSAAGWTPLMYASYVGHDTIVNLLLDSGVEASRGTPTGLTPLMVAAGCGNESVCYFLLQVSTSKGWGLRRGLVTGQ